MGRWCADGYRCRRHPWPWLCVDAQEGLVELLRIVKDGWAHLVGRPLDRSAVGVHLVGGVPAKRFEPVAGRIEEINRCAACDAMTPGAVIDARLVHREDVRRAE